jgi:hypothetical protein
MKQGGACALQHGLAGRRQHDAGAGAIEQGAAQLLLQLANRDGQRRLSHMQLLCGTVEVAGFGQSDELVQLLEIH